MGRFPNIAAAKAKTGAARGKLYGMYAREIYQVAKNGGASLDGNPSLKRLVDKAKKEQVPSDVIKRAIDKVSNGIGEDYQELTYEIFGPGSSTLMVKCFTDNANRSVSAIRAVINKCHIKMGAMGSVAFMYDNLSVVSFKGMTEDEVIEALIDGGLDADIETEGENVVLYGKPSDLSAIKDAILAKKQVEFDVDDIMMIPKDTVKLEGETLDDFNRLLGLLDEIEDVNHVYHNVEL